MITMPLTEEQLKEGAILRKLKALDDRENGGNVYDMLVLVKKENNTIPPDAFSVETFPLFPFERQDIASERILGYLS